MLSISERLKHYHVPGVSIAVIDDGEIDWARGFGIADVASQTPVSAQTLFQAASISKPIVAVAALALVQEGWWGLDEDLRRRLDGLELGSAPVTLRGLLTHSAGITQHGFPGYGMGELRPTLGQILRGEAPSKTPPIRVAVEGDKGFRYSSGGYVVLQHLLIEGKERSFPDLMRKLVLLPLGMEHSSFEQPLPKAWRGRAATGYRADESPIEGRWHLYPEMGAMGLWSTPSDLARFVIDLQKAHRGESGHRLSPSMARQMLSPNEHGRGLGPAIEGEASSLRFGHGGASEGYRCQLVGFVERGQGAVVMTNSDNGTLLIEEILRAIAAAYQWPSLRP
jgi:CubicO group peptidase (beta-lactamase class C family)